MVCGAWNKVCASVLSATDRHNIMSINGCSVQINHHAFVVNCKQTVATFEIIQP